MNLSKAWSPSVWRTSSLCSVTANASPRLAGRLSIHEEIQNIYEEARKAGKDKPSWIPGFLMKDLQHRQVLLQFKLRDLGLELIPLGFLVVNELAEDMIAQGLLE